MQADTPLPPTISFATESVTVVRSAGSVSIPVKCSGDPLYYLTDVYFICNEGTAKWGDDFDTLNPYLYFHTGEREKNLVIGINIDSVMENRSFSVRI